MTVYRRERDCMCPNFFLSPVPSFQTTSTGTNIGICTVELVERVTQDVHQTKSQHLLVKSN